MHPDPCFEMQDRAAMRDFVADRSFGALFLATPDGPRVAHVPVVFEDDDHILFHLARRNILVPYLDGAHALFVVLGEDGYISPDWYGVPDQVPTWNYQAVEMDGLVRTVSEAETFAMIDALSTAREQRLAPKPIWTRDKMKAGLAEKMARAIIGYRMDIQHWRGTNKLSQNKSDDVRRAAAMGLERAGNDALATLMYMAR